MNDHLIRRHEKPDTVTYFHFKIEKKVEEYAEFVVVTSPLNKESDPDVYISKEI